MRATWLPLLFAMLSLVRGLGLGYGLLRTKIARSVKRHVAVIVDGLECVPVTIDFHDNAFSIRSVTILEASAESQEVLVERALELEATGADGDPYGSVLWPAAKTVCARLLSMDAEELRKMTVLELGTGTGAVSLVAALCGAKTVLATDFNPFALKALERAAEMQKPAIPKDVISTRTFDVTDFSIHLPPADLLLIADLLYNPATGEAVAKRIFEAVKRGTKVILADSPRRPGRPRMIEVLTQLLGGPVVFRTVQGEPVPSQLPRHELIAATPQDAAAVSLDMALLEL